MIRRSLLAPAGLALCSTLFSVPVSAGADSPRASDDPDSTRGKTATPIKHVIVLIGENRTFDNIYGTYEPRHGQHVSNLRTKGIVREDGTPGPNAGLASQVSLKTIPTSYFIHQPASNKTPYSTLPPPNTSYIPAVGVTLAEIAQDPGDALGPLDRATFSLAQLHTISPVLPRRDLPLLTTGGTGLSICSVSATQPYPTFPPVGCFETDTRVANFASLPNSVFPLAGAKLAYDSYTGDMVHRFITCGNSPTAASPTRLRTIPAGVSTISIRTSASRAETVPAAMRWAFTTSRGVTRRS
ncbi:MAG: hypothetical protein M3O46_08285 [Myxococcota bacterium]|nr:hypothetical protein [Myxococcota bacterium]